MNNSILEKDVESIYRGIITHEFGLDILSYENCDGYVNSEDGTRDILMEFKHKTDIRREDVLYQVLVQVIYYMYRIKRKYNKLPQHILLGTDTHYGLLDAEVFYPILTNEDLEIDWSLSPSSAYKKNHKLMNYLMEIDIPNTCLHEVGTDKEEFKRNFTQLLEYGYPYATTEHFERKYNRVLGLPPSTLIKINNEKGYHESVFINPYNSRELISFDITTGYSGTAVNKVWMEGYIYLLGKYAD